jgi:hypothetical protein
MEKKRPNPGKILSLAVLFIFSATIFTLGLRGAFSGDPPKYRVTSDGTSYRVEQHFGSSLRYQAIFPERYDSIDKARRALCLQEWRDATEELRARQIVREREEWRDVRTLPPPVPAATPAPILKADNDTDLKFLPPTQTWTFTTKPDLHAPTKN